MLEISPFFIAVSSIEVCKCYRISMHKVFALLSFNNFFAFFARMDQPVFYTLFLMCEQISFPAGARGIDLDTNKQSYRYFTNARQAIEFIIDNYNKSQWFLTYIKDIEEESQNCKLVGIDIGNLYRQIYNKNRFLM